jgi:hypothetical protein
LNGDNSIQNPLQTSLASGWNLVGTPLNADVAATALQFGSQSLVSAATAGLLGKQAFTYSPVDSAYHPLSYQSGAFPAFQAAWVFAFQPGILSTPTTGTGGLTFINAPVPSTASRVEPQANAATVGNNTLVTVGGTVAYSTDGLTFTLGNTSGAQDFGSVILSSVAYGNGLFVAVGQSAFNGNNGITAEIYTSADGINWTPQTPPGQSRELGYAAVAFGNNLFVAAEGGNGNAAVSSDGVHWTGTRLAGNSDSVFQLAFGNGLFVGVGGTYGTTPGGIQTSPDGVTWTERTVGIANQNSNQLGSIGYGTVGSGALFVAAGGPVVATSADGVSWTTQQPITGGDLSNVVVGGGRILLASYANTNNNFSIAILSSGDGQSFSSPQTVPNGSPTYSNLGQAVYGFGEALFPGFFYSDLVVK